MSSKNCSKLNKGISEICHFMRGSNKRRLKFHDFPQGIPIIHYFTVFSTTIHKNRDEEYVFVYKFLSIYRSIASGTNKKKWDGDWNLQRKSNVQSWK